jgi:hypothetical protein
MQESPKAREEGKSYAVQTARQASAERRQQSRPQRLDKYGKQ